MSSDLELFLRRPSDGEPRGDLEAVDRELADLELACARYVHASAGDAEAIAGSVAAWAWASLQSLQRVDGTVYRARWEALAAVATLLRVPRRPLHCRSRLRLVLDDDEAGNGAGV